ncbi:hypothetical protein MSG28_003004 [Choristoneura fumiferana]|uniref:Uncharacterized protein n=1 Tax=Choristoneura fumiferana TaxID=7141 RepID=A0ACC0JKC3_CHOFU|nr:hypothetical protein MSG28_003004 [Choristoneura fumiferana]
MHGIRVDSILPLRILTAHALQSCPITLALWCLGQENGYCHTENATEVFKIRGFALATPMSVNAMKVALYKYECHIPSFAKQNY